MPEPDHANVDARLSRLTNLEERGKPGGDGRPILHALQVREGASTLCVTPAMEAGIADDVWSIEEIATYLDEAKQ